MSAVTPDLDVDVLGDPKSQGSLRAIIPRNAKQPVIIDDNRKPLADWRRALVVEMREGWGRPPTHLPVAVNLAFRLARPQRPQHDLPIVPPDLDKLVRAVLDAMTVARVVRDDKQVVQIHATKVYEDVDHPPGVHVKVWVVV